MKKTFTLLTILFFLAGSAITAQNIIYVTHSGTGNGSSWATATGNLQAAINSAATQTPKPDIWVAAGIYYGDSIAENNAFTMADGVDVYGGFSGNEPANYDLSLRNFETNVSILDGQNVQSVLCQADNFTDTTTWDGFTIRNGYDDGALGWLATGAILRDHSILSHCNITNNGGHYAAFDYAVYAEHSLISNCNIYDNDRSGVFLLNSTIENCNIYNNNGSGIIAQNNSFIINCDIYNNTSSSSGAGISVNNSTVTNCNIFENNITSGAVYKFGGGIYAKNSAIISNCIIHNNHVEGEQSSYGGGIYASNSIINDCDLYNNHSDYTGGGIVTSNAIVNHCRIYDNHSDFDGGGATFNDGIITNCEIHNNTATRYGGGVELYSATLHNCNIYNNTNTGTTPYGSGVYAEADSFYNNPSTVLINCNIVNNFASRTTGGIYCQTPDDTIHNIFTNCIVWGNRDNGSSEQIEIAGGVGDFSYCAVEGGWTGTNNVNLATANYGNNSALHYVNFHTPTGGAGADYDGGNWVLRAGSACIDTGTPDTTGLNLPATDLLDNNRIYNGRIDIGANEYFPGTSIADHSQNDLNTTLTLFPNPATNTVELQITNDKLQIIEIEVMDMMGKLVKTTHALNPQSATINVSVLAAGTYFVRVTTSDGNVVTKKLVKR